MDGFDQDETIKNHGFGWTRIIVDGCNTKKKLTDWKKKSKQAIEKIHALSTMQKRKIENVVEEKKHVVNWSLKSKNFQNASLQFKTIIELALFF